MGNQTGCQLFSTALLKKSSVKSLVSDEIWSFAAYARCRIILVATDEITKVYKLTTTVSNRSFHKIEDLTSAIQLLLSELGTGRVDGVAYDTAWVARLAQRYPGHGFENSLEWLRQNQYEDGTWGAPLVHHHDRFISTLAAVVALQEAGRELRDQRRIKRGEAALWKLIGKLGRDDNDTVGFPVLSASLAEEATELGLDVPHPPVRFGERYRQKVASLLSQSSRDWRRTSLSFSLEAMRTFVKSDDDVLESNNSASVSPSATAGYLLSHDDPGALSYLKQVTQANSNGGVPALSPIDTFEIAWSLNHLQHNGAVEPDNFEVRRVLRMLVLAWSKEVGVGYSTYVSLPEIDDTAAAFTVLNWGGYSLSPNVFASYELADHFCCFRGETDPSVSIHIRLLIALRLFANDPQCELWIGKILHALQKFDQNGSFWSDKWHASPYYVNSAALYALHKVADDLAQSRLKWILRTQNDDGGWGYLGVSTPEETAYCLEALLFWDRTVNRVDQGVLDSSAQYLMLHLNDGHYAPLWIGKSLYTPHNVVKSVILSALFSYYCWGS